MSDIEAEIRRQMLAEQEARMHEETIDEGTSTPSAAPVSAPPGYQTPIQNPGARSDRRKGVLGGLGAVGAAVAKFWSFILLGLGKLKFLLIIFKLGTFGKLLLAGGSMLLSMWAYAYRFGWPFGITIVMLICIHECGHALAATWLGRKVGIMVFIPFCGAFVTSRGGRNVREDAFIGIMGPVAGTLAGIGCCVLFLVTGHIFWLVAAWFNFQINLLNLAPSPPLDGGWLLPIFSPRLLLPCVVIGLFLFRHNPMVWLLAIMSIPRILFAWNRHDSSYYEVSTVDRWMYGLAWAGLAIFLALASTLIPVVLTMHHRLAM